MNQRLPGCEPLSAPAPCELWRIDLTTPLPSDVHEVLSSHERARAQRFAFETHRRRYLFAHWAMKNLLARHAGTRLGELHYGFGPYGKPYLARPHSDLNFNFSDSDDVALVAMAPHVDVGVDVELLRSVPDALELAQAHFTESEREQLRGASNAAQRDRRFLVGWTRKEACLKAIGSGLSIGAHTFEAGLDEAPRRVGIPVGTSMAWVEVHTVQAGEDCVAALACRVEHAGS